MQYPHPCHSLLSCPSAGTSRDLDLSPEESESDADCLTVEDLHAVLSSEEDGIGFDLSQGSGAAAAAAAATAGGAKNAASASATCGAGVQGSAAAAVGNGRRWWRCKDDGEDDLLSDDDGALRATAKAPKAPSRRPLPPSSAASSSTTVSTAVAAAAAAGKGVGETASPPGKVLPEGISLSPGSPTPGGAAPGVSSTSTAAAAAAAAAGAKTSEPPPLTGNPTADAITGLLWFHVGLRDELNILKLLTEATDLNCVLANIKIGALLRAFRNHRFRQAPNKTNLLLLLGKVRVKDLSIQSKVLIVAAVARHGNKDIEEQRMVLDLFEATHGMELFDLKHKLDHHAYDTTLSWINVRVFTDPMLRSSFEFHLSREADELRSCPGFTPHVHALSDIDDTFVHSGYGLGGPKYPKGSVLPGVVTLFTSLKAHVVFVTARPAAARRFTYKAMRRLQGVKNVAILTGKLRDSVLIPFKPQIANELIAARKLDNFCRHYKMFPECQFMWFGDSGQSDIEVGVRLMGHGCVLGAYIQDVARPDGVVLATGSMERHKFQQSKVYIADNYVDVAVRMHDSGLLSDKGLHDTALDAVIQLAALRTQFLRPEVFAARVRELRVALDSVNRKLTQRGFCPVLVPGDMIAD